MGKLSGAVSGDDEAARGRRESLATMTQRMTDDGAFQRLVQENAPEVDRCRQILKKKPGKRTLDDVHVVRGPAGGCVRVCEVPDSPHGSWT